MRHARTIRNVLLAMVLSLGVSAYSQEPQQDNTKQEKKPEKKKKVNILGLGGSKRLVMVESGVIQGRDNKGEYFEILCDTVSAEQFLFIHTAPYESSNAIYSGLTKMEGRCQTESPEGRKNQ